METTPGSLLSGVLYNLSMIDPLELARATEALVCRDGLRKYYRFRPSRFYGGISTADCVGCCLRCVFCWAWNVVVRPAQVGQFYSPQEVAERLLKIARKKRFGQLRISGNEPTIGWAHLMGVLPLVGKGHLFVLETNGILLGANPEYAEDLARFKENLYVRVSLKGTCEEEFSRLTGAKPEGFSLQLKALENLLRRGVRAFPASMVSFSPRENIQALAERLRTIHPAFEEFEVEELILYPHVEERLKKLGICYYTAHKPEGIPPEQV